ncbi:MAG: flagellar basal-body rod protein FlgG [Candidatus Margulisbacteria bacterium]|nr:flagellar basal-body rod protein FlgG [Candidatus Margulisiibacteriota bacterium]
MTRSMWISATGMMAQQLNIDVIANNLANVNTTGFKKSRVDFEDLMYQKLSITNNYYNADQQGPPVQVGLGVRSTGVPKVYTGGSFQQTGNDLDLAIEGSGFLQVRLPDGTIGYTRAGILKKDGEGYISTPDGFLLEPTLQIPNDAEEIFISPEGKVSVSKAGSIANEEVGQIYLIDFPNPAGLESQGRNVLKETPVSGSPIESTPGLDGLGTIAQGYLEGSNVDIAEEMIKMIIAQRSYEINSKAIQTSDELLSMTNNLKR